MKSPVEYGEQVFAEMVLSEFYNGFSIMSEPIEIFNQINMFKNS